MGLNSKILMLISIKFSVFNVFSIKKGIQMVKYFSINYFSLSDMLQS